MRVASVVAYCCSEERREQLGDDFFKKFHDIPTSVPYNAQALKLAAPSVTPLFVFVCLIAARFVALCLIAPRFVSVCSIAAERWASQVDTEIVCQRREAATGVP